MNIPAAADADVRPLVSPSTTVGNVKMPARHARADAASELAGLAVQWLLNAKDSDWDDYSLYHGLSGILLALHETA